VVPEATPGFEQVNVQTLELPFFVKPVVGRLSQLARRIDDLAELDELPAHGGYLDDYARLAELAGLPREELHGYLAEELVEGDEVTLTRAAGTFCLTDSSAPLLAFSGGSGVTPILSLAKSALATTDRRVRLLCADRDRQSVIFEGVLDELVARHPDRLTVVRHIDADSGLLDPAAVVDFVGEDTDADCYVCGPEGFMSVVTAALPGPGKVFIEDFDAAPTPVADAEAPEPASAEEAADVQGTITIHLDRKKATVPRVAKETLLESARRAGLSPPFSCEAGNCGTCMARLSEGKATMRVNDALMDDEVEEGYVLTCQAVPDTPSVTVHYED
jgi:ferredoxin-NADP reductase